MIFNSGRHTGEGRNRGLGAWIAVWLHIRIWSGGKRITVGKVKLKNWEETRSGSLVNKFRPYPRNNRQSIKNSKLDNNLMCQLPL